jgi:hypothetical protein
MRSALTCVPMRAADRLRATGVGRRSLVGTADAGTRTGRAVGSGDGSNLTDIRHLSDR